MPISIPAFQSYQAPLVPLRGLWHAAPKEGDRLIGCEVAWATYNKGPGVKFDVGGNSPVSLSQIVALYVDNGRCGSDIDFLFPDTGFLLTVPAHVQGLYPVFTNALSFIAINNTEGSSDYTVFQICNSLPPPISILPSTQQAQSASVATSLVNSQTLAVVPAGISGTVTGISVVGQLVGNAGGTSAAAVDLQDGEAPPKVIWNVNWSAPANGLVPVSINITGLNVRFINGINLVSAIVVSNGFLGSGAITANVYYTTP